MGLLNKLGLSKTSSKPIIFLTSDNIHNPSVDMQFMKDICSKLKVHGYNAYPYDIGPNTQNTVLQSKNVPNNAFVVNLYGGADAGIINAYASKWFKTIKGKRTVFPIWIPPSTNITGLVRLNRAHDDNYDPKSFTGLDHPDQFLHKNGYNYAYCRTVDEVVNAVLGELEPKRVEVDVSKSQIKLMAAQFIWMYNHYYKGSKAGSKIYLDKSKTQYITHDKYHELLTRWNSWKAKYKQRPAYILINKPKPVVVTVGHIQTALQKGIGTFSNLTSAYNLTKGRGKYKKYFDNQKDLKQEIDGLINNCVDWAELFHALAHEMGYTVRFIGIHCTVEDINHAYIEVIGKEFKSWTALDLAAATESGYNIGSHWCNGIKTINPTWIPSEDTQPA